MQQKEKGISRGSLEKTGMQIIACLQLATTLRKEDLGKEKTLKRALKKIDIIRI